MFKNYSKKDVQPLRPYVPGEDVSAISLGGGQPELGDMIAVAKNDPADQWLIKKAFFDDNYVEAESEIPNYEMALSALKKGKKAGRSGWNGKGMFIFLVPGSVFKVNRHPLLGIYPEGTEINYHAHIDMKTADGTVVPWLCSQTDALAEDWEIVE